MKKIILLISIFTFVYAECLGDLNQDNAIDILDAVELVSNILVNADIEYISDLNHDNYVDILDVIIIINIILTQDNLCEAQWGEETNVVPEFYLTDDIENSHIDQIVEYYIIAQETWGNYGPLEFWVVGTNLLQAAQLDYEYCELRLEKDPCLGDNFLQWCLNREYSFVDYANYGGAGLSLSRQYHWNCDGYSYMEITLSSKYPFPNETDYNVVTMHEYFHAYQQAHIDTYDYNERAALMVVNPWWSEGGAEYMAQLLYSQQPSVYSNYLRDRMSWKMESKNDLIDGELISDIPYGNRAYIAYDLGAWAIAYLISLVGKDAYLIDFYDSLNQHNWEQSFILNFNMTPDQFLIDFHGFLDLNINQQLDILP